MSEASANATDEPATPPSGSEKMYMPDGSLADFVTWDRTTGKRTPRKGTPLTIRGLWLDVEESAGMASRASMTISEGHGTWEGRTVASGVHLDLVNKLVHFHIVMGPTEERWNELVKLYGGAENVPENSDGFVSRCYVVSIQEITHQLLHNLTGSECKAEREWRVLGQELSTPGTQQHEAPAAP